MIFDYSANAQITPQVITFPSFESEERAVPQSEVLPTVELTGELDAVEYGGGSLIE